MSSEPTTVRSDLSEIIAENFGANATYVETLLARFRSDPSLVDESWRTYFEELFGSNGGAAPAAKSDPAATPVQPASDGAGAPAQTQPAAKPQKPKSAQAAASPQVEGERVPIRGAAL